MCGLVGWIASSSPALNRDAMERALSAISHRGPDGSGIFSTPARQGNGQVVMGHCRLAIIDVTNAQQPMIDAESGLTLVYNGEIYNFRELRAELVSLGASFKLDSDTEVLLRAYQQWGWRCVERLRGMFAFAVWDARSEELTLARDRFGKKPLFVSRRGREIYFASEIKALLTLPGFEVVPDVHAIWEYLSYRYVPGPRTLFSGIAKLAPGSVAIWRNGEVKQLQYFVPPDAHGVDQSASPQFAVSEFAEKLGQAVQMRLVSDVPFGAFLSGGIDSSAVVAMMARCLESPIKTFSVGFSESGHSELDYARLIAKQFATDHHEITVSVSDVMNVLPKLVHFRDAPASEPADAPMYLLSRAAAREVKMVLTGEGADEVLGGYPKHVAERFQPNYQKIPRWVRTGLIQPLVQALPFRYRRLKTAVVNLNLEDWRDRAVRWFGALSADERELFSTLHVNGVDKLDAPRQFEIKDNSSALRRLLYFDQTSWLPDNLLERGDRMSMAASLEVRMPFMDHELVQFVAALPDHYRIRGLKTKWLLYQAMRGVLPDAVLARPKVGFRMPIDQWLRTSMKSYLMDHLATNSCRIRQYCRPNVLDRILKEHLRGEQNHEKLLWSLLNLELWHRIYA